MSFFCTTGVQNGICRYWGVKFLHRDFVLGRKSVIRTAHLNRRGRPALISNPAAKVCGCCFGALEQLQRERPYTKHESLPQHMQRARDFVVWGPSTAAEGKDMLSKRLFVTKHKTQKTSEKTHAKPKHVQNTSDLKKIIRFASLKPRNPLPVYTCTR